MPLFDGILNGLLANQRTQVNRGLQFDNDAKQQGLFESGLKRFRQNQFDKKFEDLSAEGLDPLRNSLSLFRNATRPDEAQAALGLFTSLRQPAASASLFDANATGVPGLGGSATDLTRRGLGGLNAALSLEQQDTALGLSQVNNPALALSQFTGSGREFDNQPLLQQLGGLQDTLARSVGAQRAAAIVKGIAQESGAPNQGVQSGQTDTTVDPAANDTSTFAGGDAPNNAGFRSPVEKAATGVKTAMQDLDGANDRLIAAKALPNVQPSMLRPYEQAVMRAEKQLEIAKINNDIALLD